MLVFFFQAEDGIRDSSVTGVQTCALPIYDAPPAPASQSAGSARGASFSSPFTGNERVLPFCIIHETVSLPFTISLHNSWDYNDYADYSDDPRIAQRD